MSDAAQINQLRLKLERAAHIYSSSETHELMERTLGRVWRIAVETWNDDKALAAKFLLNENILFEGKRPFDVALKDKEGLRRVYDYIGELQDGDALQYAVRNSMQYGFRP